LVALLGYAPQMTLNHLLKRNGSEYSQVQALKRLSEEHGVDILLRAVEEGREIWLRYQWRGARRTTGFTKSSRF